MKLGSPGENIVLAPRAGVTDRAFRELARSFGASMSYTEMVSAKGIQYNNKKTFELLQVGDGEGTAGVQLFGREPDTIAHMAARLEQACGERIAVFDVNMGCPAPKIVNNGEGSALMKEPELAARIIETLKKAVTRPVSVKFRRGFERGTETCVEFARMAQEAGADLIAVHGRTREQYYEGKADWQAIARVKQAVYIPVLANGDVFSPEDAKAILEVTGADGVMVARGALGNPMIFREIREYLSTGSYRKATWQERLEVAVQQARLTCQYKPERMAMREMRKHGAWYVKGLKNAARWREKLVRVETLADYEGFMEQIALEAESK
ncbi:MAG: tRNA dihydrouridine synthase DusB [Christensenellaceae bacterium]|nr:tRNA dihydrouridine synthase DusB [Christensenellaceae bacterium]